MLSAHNIEKPSSILRQTKEIWTDLYGQKYYTTQVPSTHILYNGRSVCHYVPLVLTTCNKMSRKIALARQKFGCNTNISSIQYTKYKYTNLTNVPPSQIDSFGILNYVSATIRNRPSKYELTIL